MSLFDVLTPIIQKTVELDRRVMELERQERYYGTIDLNGYTATFNGNFTAGGALTINTGTSGKLAYYSASGTIEDLTSPVSVSLGGTGATSASGALSNLGAAAASHTHAASGITSGTISTSRLGSGTASASNVLHGDSTWSAVILTAEVSGILPIANGGTGASSAGSALSNLGAAASSHTHAASDITSGTISTSRLGSGTASASNVLHGDSTWSAVILTAEVSGTLPVANGGTGATSASSALSNLGGVSGTGSNGGIAIWNGTTGLTFQSNCYISGGTLHVSGALESSSGTSTVQNFLCSQISTGSGYWTLGQYVAGAPAATGYVTVTIGGTARKLLAA